MKAMSEERTLLLRAAALVEERGWCQHQFYRETGQICAQHALSLAAEGVPTDGSVRTDARKLLKQSLGLSGSCCIPQWNDAQGRTKDEVIAALREAALYGLATIHESRERRAA